MHAYALIEDNAADPVASEKVFYQGAIPGLLRTLDPHSIFFDPGQFEQVKQHGTSTQKGFGSVVSLLPGRVIILQTRRVRLRRKPDLRRVTISSP